ncbi:MAG: hypothetical protein ACOCZ4_00335 [Bacteroidota bacterium]
MLNPTISEANLKTSLRMFFYEEFEQKRDTPVTFDRGLSLPYTSGQVGEDSLDGWIAVFFNVRNFGILSEQIIDFYCCSRKDVDQVILDDIMDIIMETLYPEDHNVTIPFYDVETEEIIGHIFPLRIYQQQGNQTALDGTNFKVVSVGFKWATTI